MKRILPFALILASSASAQLLEDFEHGNIGLYTLYTGATSNATLDAGAAHDGALGAGFGTGASPWHVRSDVPTAPGNVYSAFVRLRGSQSNNGRSYLGVGATPTGTFSAVFAPNTGTIILQDNSNYFFADILSTPFAVVPDTWYQLRLTWAANGDMTVDLLDEAGAVVLASTGTASTGYTVPGGLAVRGFSVTSGEFHDVDTIRGPAVGIGMNYCGPAVVNSTGASGVMSASGSATVASNDLTLTASNLPNNAFGYFLTSLTQGNVPNPGGSVGVLCLGGAIGRYVGPGQIQNTGSIGAYSLLLDLTQTPSPTGFVAIAAGQSWNFQGWHRDAVGGVAVSNFTDGLRVTFN